MRQHFTPYTSEEKMLYRQLKKLIDEHGMTRGQAGAHLGIPFARVGQLMNRSYPTPLEMRERRKKYIVNKMMDMKRKNRASPYLIAKFFMIDESFVMAMIQELREEGRLPRGEASDEMERQSIIRTLQRNFSNVYRAITVQKHTLHGDKLYVAGKGWLTWQEAADLAETYRQVKSK